MEDSYSMSDCLSHSPKDFIKRRFTRRPTQKISSLLRLTDTYGTVGIIGQETKCDKNTVALLYINTTQGTLSLSY